MKYIIFFTMLFFTHITQAQLHVEPYGNMGAVYATGAQGSTLSLNYGLGGRVGYRVVSVVLGVDAFWNYYSTGSTAGAVSILGSETPEKGFSQAQSTSSLQYSTGDKNFSPISVGIFVAIDLPFLFDAYGTVFYSFVMGQNAGLQPQNGYGAKVGISYLSAFYVKLNLEAQWAQYNCNVEGGCPGYHNNYISGMFSVSVPLSFDIFGGGGESSVEDDSPVEEEIADSSEEENSEEESSMETNTEDDSMNLGSSL